MEYLSQATELWLDDISISEQTKSESQGSRFFYGYGAGLVLPAPTLHVSECNVVLSQKRAESETYRC